jgi:hypothetical protein
VGVRHVKGKHRRLASRRRPRPRICLRKGCGREYQPRCWHQHYCQEPECSRLVRRWQAAKRQAEHRQSPLAKARHAQTEKLRRQRDKLAPQSSQEPEVAPARGHAAEIFFCFPYAIGQAAMNPLLARLATPHTTAVLPVVRRFAMSSIVNASGFLAAPGMAARSDLMSTETHDSADHCGHQTLPTRHLPSYFPPRARRSFIIA